jgi:MtaA/CmuA family methyltransferase
MVNTSPRAVFQAMLEGAEVEPFPSIIPINPPIVDVMKFCSTFWPEAHRHAAPMAALAEACQELLGFNAVNVPFDMTVEAEALGCELIWKEGISATPQVRERSSDEGLTDFDESVLERGRVPVVLEAIALLRKRCGDTIPVVPFFEGPFTLAGMVGGVNGIYRYLLKDPERATEELEAMCRVIIPYARRQLDAGADTAIMLDPNVMGLTRKQFVTFVLPLYREITAAVGNPLILHICGDVTPLLDTLSTTGFAAFSFDYPAVAVRDVREALPQPMKIIGSVPTVTHLLQGTPSMVFEISLGLIEQGVDLLAPSCFTPPEAPLENVRAMKRAIEHWNSRP